MSSNPVLSNCVFCLGTWTLGDIAAQRLGHHDDTEPFKVDPERTLHFASFGVLVNGPVLAKWYPFLNRTTKRILASPRVTSLITSLPPRCAKLSAPVTKVVIETVCFNLPFLATFYAYINAAEGGDLETCRHKLETKLLPSFVTGLAIWPATQLTNFRFVPTLYQPYVVNVVAVGWDGYLSHKNHQENNNNNHNSNERELCNVTTNVVVAVSNGSETSTLGGSDGVAVKCLPNVT